MKESNKKKMITSQIKRVFRQIALAFFVVTGISNASANDNILHEAGQTAQQAQRKKITGTIKGEDGEPIPGAAIFVKGNTIGTISDINGFFTIEIPMEITKLNISFIGMVPQVIELGNQTNFSIVMQEEVKGIDEIVVVGMRGAQIREIQAKRNAATVIESITPEDIGNFSDESVTDALERVPGVQIERDETGVEGDRVSVRGLGSQFVGVTINGRTPLSAGNEGTTNFRKFNVGVLPPEIVHGAKVYKTPDATLVDPGMGGGVDFQTLRPLNIKYRDNRNFMVIANARGEYNPLVEGVDIQPRLSAGLGFKTKNNKLGFFASVIKSRSERSRAETYTRVNPRDIRVDSNGDGIFNEEDGDILYEGILTPTSRTNNPIQETRERLGYSASLQWKPLKNFEILVDYTSATYNNMSNRTLSRQLISFGGNNGIYSNKNFFKPEDVVIEDNYLRYFTTSGYKSRVQDQVSSLQFDNNTTNNIGGINIKYNLKGWIMSFDYSMSNLDFRQNLITYGAMILDYSRINQDGIIYDVRGGAPMFSWAPDDNATLDYTLYGFKANKDVLAPGNQGYRIKETVGNNYAYKFDIKKKLSKRMTIQAGARYSSNEVDYRTGNGQDRKPTEEQFQIMKDAYKGNFINNFISEKNIGSNSWIYANRDIIREGVPEFYTVNEGNLFSVNFRDLIGAETELKPNPNSGYIREEGLALYGQMNFKTMLWGRNLSGNLGVRAIRTDINAIGFSGVSTKSPDPDEEDVDVAINAVTEVKSSRWDVNPSLNLKWELNRNLVYRLSLSRAVSRPKLTDLVPTNKVSSLSADFINGPDYDPNELYSQNSIKKANVDLKPYSAWQMDHTFEYYLKTGGALVFSGFYKKIHDYILNIENEGQPFPGEDALGLELDPNIPWDEMKFTIKQAENFTDADLYGFEFGFNQMFRFLPNPFNYFGVKGNYNFVSSSFSKDVGDNNNGFPGSSKHSVNGVLYFDKDRLNWRLAYSYRSDYLRQLGGAGDRIAQTVFTEGRSKLNFRIAYNMLRNRNLQLSLSATNLTGANQVGYIGSPGNTYQYIDLDRTYTLGIRYKL
ncbi:MAG: TonB-dependent receptor [Carboxylicivirga sp.]|jgi:TonB-dependent receptor|nr:TonB-dependent receptor [Carboxylicivirga sp.]